MTKRTVTTMYCDMCKANLLGVSREDGAYLEVRLESGYDVPVLHICAECAKRVLAFMNAVEEA